MTANLPLAPAMDALSAPNSTLNSLPLDMDLKKQVMNGLLANMTMFSMLMASVSKDRWFPKTKQTVQSEYDYVIIGGGTAGSVMANRLSEVECVTVLLLEAGGAAPVLTEIPSFARVTYGDPEVDWYYKTIPQKYSAFGQVDNSVTWNSGKGFGGTSLINAMLYVRGNMLNYDDWVADGCDGWGYNDVLPYFKKLEDNKNIDEEDDGYHNTGGPMTFDKAKYKPSIKDPLLEATRDMGYDLTDINGRRQTGMSDFQATIRNGLRCSTAKAYLVPAENRTNLDIVGDAFARKILFKKQRCSKKLRAYAVEFDHMGELKTVKARREIIISSGTVRTPQILMLSGIGPREHLQTFSIPCIADLPVGQNLQDHCASFIPYITNSTNIVLQILNPINILKFITDRSGPMASVNELTLLAFLDGLKTNESTPDFPRQELYFGEYSTVDALKNSNLKPETYAQIYGGHELQPLYVCYASLLQPYSRGEILLKSTDPHEPPLINPNYYEDPRDLKDVVTGLKICDAVASHPAMQQVQTKPLGSLYPGCEKFVGNDDEYYGCQAKTIITTFWHTVGTAKMGHPDDPRSVVDPELRVIGVDRLRVVNAAVMPIVPSGNTNVPTMMVAEKAADIIKKTIRCRNKKSICP